MRSGRLIVVSMLIVAVLSAVVLALPRSSTRRPISSLRNPAGPATVPPSSLRSGLVRSPNPIDTSSNLIITGNVRRGRHFRGSVPYRSQMSFGATLGSTSLDSFIRDSAGVEDFGRYRSSARAYQRDYLDYFYSPTETVTKTRAGQPGAFRPSSTYRVSGRAPDLFGLEPIPKTTEPGRIQSGAGTTLKGRQPGVTLTAEQIEQLSRRWGPSSWESTGGRRTIRGLSESQQQRQQPLSSELLGLVEQPSQPQQPDQLQQPSRLQQTEATTKPGQELFGLGRSKDSGTEQPAQPKRGKAETESPGLSDKGLEMGPVTVESPKPLEGKEQIQQLLARIQRQLQKQLVQQQTGQQLQTSQQLQTGQQQQIVEAGSSQQSSQESLYGMPQESTDSDQSSSGSRSGPYFRILSRQAGSTGSESQTSVDQADTPALESLRSSLRQRRQRLSRAGLDLELQGYWSGLSSRSSSVEQINSLSRSQLSARAKQIMGPHTNLEDFTQARFERHMRTAIRYLHQGQYYQAANAFVSASIYKPKHPGPYAGRSLALLAAGEYVSSSLFLQRAIEQDSRYLYSKVDIVALLGDRDKLDSRVADLEQWRARSLSWQLDFLVGYIYYRLGRLDEAKDAVELAAEKKPQALAVQALKRAVNEALKSAQGGGGSPEEPTSDGSGQ